MTAPITFDVLARDQASKALRKVGDELETLNHRASKFAKEFVASLGIAFGAEKLVEFSKSAIDAFTQTQRAEERLEDAFRRFPKLADTNAAALRAMNDQIERRTGFLSRDLAAGEANLAQFNLTGTQLKTITPLLVDYADKTGQAIPEAATLLGRALLGNQRALKSIGITIPAVTSSAKLLAKAHKDVESTTTTLAKAQDRLKIAEADMAGKRKVTLADTLRYKDVQNAVRDAYDKNQTALANLRAAQDKTGHSASQVDKIIGALRGKVGGFADKESQTAAGQLRKLSAEFDRTKVEIGQQLLPVVVKVGHFLNDTFIPDLKHVADWLKRNEDVIVPLAKVIGGLTIAVVATHKATAVWASVSKAAATWSKALGAASATAAPEVAAQGTAAGAAATENAALAGTARSAAGAIEAEGVAAATAGGRIAGMLGLLARVGPAAAAAEAILAGKAIYDRSHEDNKNVKALTAGALANPLNYSTLVGQASQLQALQRANGSGFGGVSSRLLADYNKAIANVDAARRAAQAAASDPYRNRAGDFNNGLPSKGAVVVPHLSAATTAAAKTAKGVKDILAGVPQFAVGSGTGIADGIAKGIKARERAALAAAKSLASKLKTQIDSIKSTLNSLTSSITGTITGNAGLLNTGNQTTQGLIYFEQHQLSIDRTFHTNLARMVKLGFSPTYISELAQAGPMQAGNIVANLAHASTAQVRALNRTTAAIGASARSTASLAANDIYHKQYAELQRQTAELVAVKKEIARITSDLATLARTGHLQTTVRSG